MPRGREFDALLLTCEHGGNAVPGPYKKCFKGARSLLATHRGWDIGALSVAERLAAELGAPLHFSEVSRLVVDLNRSAHHRLVFSDFTRSLPQDTREAILAEHYRPYRAGVEGWIARRVGQGKRVLHLSMHSFTPVLGDQVRNAEIGLLYDPRRGGEARFAGDLHAALQGSGAGEQGLRIRRNYPYLGICDGLVTHLRRQFPAARYVGMEIEMSQGVIAGARGQRSMGDLFVQALSATR